MIKVGDFKDGLDMSAIREIKFLQELRHQNIIELVDVFSSQTNLNLVLEYLPADLEMVIKDKSIIFGGADVKSWLLMTLRGLHHCHRNFVIHQDLKPNNLLLSPDGHLKIADFGLARASPTVREVMTPTVVTRWYRAPELLLGSKFYTTSIDIWSVGMIFAELMLRTPYLPGSSDTDQVDLTFRALGTPTEKIWPGVSSLPGHSNSWTIYPQPSEWELQNRFSAAGPNALELMNSMIKLNPAQRVDTTAALMSKYFSEEPAPTKPENLPRKSQQEKDLEKDLADEKRRNMIRATREARA
jgi:cyclin-dependent kinase 7